MTEIPSREELFKYSQQYAVSEIEKELRKKPRKTSIQILIEKYLREEAERLKEIRKLLRLEKEP